MRHASVFGHVQISSYLLKLNLFIVEVLSQVLYFLLSNVTVVVVLGFGIVFLLGDIQILLVVSSKVGLYFIDFVP